MKRETIIEAELTWLDDGFEPNIQIVVGPNGLIEQVGFLDLQPTLRLEDRALLPGLVNVHSLGFQRGLRGLHEAHPGAFPEAAWVQAVDELVEYLGAEAFRNFTRMAYEEMLHHGITSVGEFHTLHHESDDEDYAFDDLVLAAASDAGIRLVLLCGYRGPSAHARGSAAARGRTSGVERFCRHLDRLRAPIDGKTPRIGVAIPDLSATSSEDLVQLAAYARLHNLPFHVAIEGGAAAEACRRAHGASPLEFVLNRGLLGPHATLIHASGAPAELLGAAARTGARLCTCPLTEARIGWPRADWVAFRQAGGDVCMGSGSNVRISMNEEWRWLAYDERARMAAISTAPSSPVTAAGLLRAATAGGAAALGLPAGRIVPGQTADFFAVDMGGLSLLGATAETMLPAFVFGADRACITDLCVGGTWHRHE